MNKFKHKVLALSIAMAIFGTAYADVSEGVELIRNGDFSSGLEAWETVGNYTASISPYTPDVSIVDDSPNSQALKINGVSGSNYFATVSQDVNLTSSFSSFDISFDWKVTEKESQYGANYVMILFLNEEEVKIGQVAYWDTGRRDGHSLSYWRGDLAKNQFIGVRKYLEVFDWERVSVNTSAMTGMDASQVSKISVGFSIQNDAGNGGVMLVDNFSVIGKTTTDAKCPHRASFSINDAVLTIPALDFPDRFGDVITYRVEMSLVAGEGLLFAVTKAEPMLVDNFSVIGKATTDAKCPHRASFSINDAVLTIPAVEFPDRFGGVITYRVEMSLVAGEGLLFGVTKAEPVQ
jgi:hypothetical protein